MAAPVRHMALAHHKAAILFPHPTDKLNQQLIKPVQAMLHQQANLHTLLNIITDLLIGKKLH